MRPASLRLRPPRSASVLSLPKEKTRMALPSRKSAPLRRRPTSRRRSPMTAMSRSRVKKTVRQSIRLTLPLLQPPYYHHHHHHYHVMWVALALEGSCLGRCRSHRIWLIAGTMKQQTMRMIATALSSASGLLPCCHLRPQFPARVPLLRYPDTAPIIDRSLHRPILDMTITSTTIAATTATILPSLTIMLIQIFPCRRIHLRVTRSCNQSSRCTIYIAHFGNWSSLHISPLPSGLCRWRHTRFDKGTSHSL